MTKNEFNGYLARLKTSKRAFSALYTFYYPKIVRFIRGSYQDKVSGEDVAHDFFNFLLGKESFEVVEYPTAWVFGVAKHIAYKAYKKDSVSVAFDDELFDDEYVFEDDYIENEELRSALRSLDGKSRAIIAQHIFLGLPLKDIATKNGENYSTVRNRYSRALKALKNILKNF